MVAARHGVPKVSLNAFSLQAVLPKAGATSATTESAQPAPGGAPPGGSSGAMLMTFAPLLLIVPILFMSFRRQKKEADARSKLKRGDRITTNAGIIGELVEVDDKIAKVKIAPGTTVQVLASTISAFPEMPTKSGASPSAQ